MADRALLGSNLSAWLRTARRLLIVVAFAAALILAAGLPAQAFSSFSAPLTGGTDFVTGFAHCTTLGPTGVLQDGTNFFATDYCNGTTYKLPATGGTVAAATAVPNGLTHMLTLAHGVYYGASNGAHGLPPGLYSFSPSTLAVGPRIAGLAGEPRGVVGDPLSNDVYVAASGGIFRVQSPDTSPVVTQVASGNFDGLQVTADGQHFWVANVGTGHVQELGRPGPTTLPLQADVAVPGGPDGIAIARGDAPGGVAGNVFVNDNNGTITRIDTNSHNALSIVASGGSRGDFATVGPDGCFYVTQTDRVVKLAPCFFQAPTADLSVVKSVSASSTSILQPLVYTFTVANAGPSAASGVTLTDALPAGVQFVSATSAAGTCGQSGGVVTCDLGTIPRGGSATATIAVSGPLLPATVVNTATVKGHEADPSTANNTATATTVVGLLGAAAPSSPTPSPTPTPTPSPSPTVLGQQFVRVLPVTGPGFPLTLLAVLGLGLLAGGLALVRRSRSRGAR
jgi:uncharacterized repeat protein (TIGR01451 family)